MKQTFLFSSSKKVHDVRFPGPRPASVVPEPLSPPPSQRPFASCVDQDPHRAAASPRPPSPVRVGPRLVPGNLKTMRKLLFDSSKTLAQRMPTMRAILKDSTKNQTPANDRRTSGLSARTRAIREYESNHRKDDESEVSYGWVIMPRATWKVRWDLWIGLIIFYSVVLIPYRIGFGIDVEVRSMCVIGKLCAP